MGQPTREISLYLQELVRQQLAAIGEDPDREGLVKTPYRVVKAWQELFAGYGQDPAVILATDFAADGYNEMIVCKDIEFYSTCEHHMLPFTGVAHVGYIPNERVVGLSKLARLVDCFARRLQLQERLTESICRALEQYVQPKGAGVVIDARHFCMICRGARKQQARMVTSSLRGLFLEGNPRAEFLSLCGAASAI